MKLAFLILTLLVAASSRGGQETRAAASAWELLDEQWYTVELNGAKAGSMSTTVESDEHHYRTVSQVQMSFGRGPFSAEVEIASTFVETRAGEPVSLKLVQDMAMQSVQTEWRFRDDHVVQSSRQGEREITREVPLPADPWLTPMAVHRHWLKRLEAGAKQITYRMLDAQAGLDPIEVTHSYVGEGEFEFDGRTIPVTQWKTTTSLLPVVAREQYDAEGHLVYQEVEAGIGTMVTRLATREQALARKPGRAPDVLVSTFVEPDKPIERPGRTTTATLRLRVGEGQMPRLPSAGAQRATMSDDTTAATVTIDVNDPHAAAPAADEADAFLGPSAMVDAGDPLIQKLAARAIEGAGDDPLARADAMRAAVYGLLTEKSLDTAFATASETARTRTGDCSEHAVLLCAMLRAESIPARVAIGLIYADEFLGRENIFGWHMWTQALVDGKWVDLDATLPRRYHAAHVLTGTSSLDEGALGPELASTLLLMGNLQIEVLDVGYD